MTPFQVFGILIVFFFILTLFATAWVKFSDWLSEKFWNSSLGFTFFFSLPFILIGFLLFFLG